MEHAAAVAATAQTIGPANPFHRYADYLRLRYGKKTYRVSVDAGFTCPVRETGKPCTYCDVRGSRAPYLGDTADLKEQISSGLRFLSSRYRAERFLLYFQAFSNTYAPVAELRRVYDLGLEQGPFEGLIVSTRPDCLDRERAELLAGYREQGLDVWVELGLQSSNDRTLKRIQRGHTAAQFARAATICKDHGILTAAHVMLGLPGESERDAVQTSVFLDKVGIDAVKFHNLVIVEGTQLYREYLEGRATAPEAKTYLGLLISALERLPRHVVVMRLTCDPPSDAITIPGEMPEKFSFVQQLAKTMMARETWQGRTLDTR